MEAPGPATTAILASPGLRRCVGACCPRGPTPSVRHFGASCGWISVSNGVTQESQDRATAASSQPPTRGVAVYIQSGCIVCYYNVQGCKVRDFCCGSLENIILYLSTLLTPLVLPPYKKRGDTRSTSTTEHQQPPHSSCLRLSSLEASRHCSASWTAGCRIKPRTDGPGAACTSNLRGRQVT